MGTIAGIARHGRPRGEMEILDCVAISVESGLAGDFRGAVKLFEQDNAHELMGEGEGPEGQYQVGAGQHRGMQAEGTANHIGKGGVPVGG